MSFSMAPSYPLLDALFCSNLSGMQFYSDSDVDLAKEGYPNLVFWARRCET